MTSEIGILALDLALTTGFAHSDGTSGVVDFHDLRRGESPGMRFLNFRAWLLKFLAEHPAKVLAYEQAGHHRSNAARHICEGLIAHAEAVAAELEMELTSRSPPDLKKRLFGKFSPKTQNKTKVVQQVENRWPHLQMQTDDQADAIVLLWFVMSDLGIEGTYWHIHLEKDYE